MWVQSLVRELRSYIESERKESEVSQSYPTWQPHELQPTRLLGPWDFPGKSTGVGCHCLLPYLFTSLPKSLTSSHLWDANDHPPLPGRRGEKTLTTGGPGKEQGTNKLPPTRILQRSTRGQQEMGDCSPEVLATSSEQQRPSIVKTNSMLPKTNKSTDRSEEHTSELQSPTNLVCRLLLEKKK